MVSVKKVEKTISYFGQIKLKVQLIVNFTILSLISCSIISILITVFIQKKITDRILNDSSQYVSQRVQLEMSTVIGMMINQLQTSLFIMGQFIYEVEQVTKDTFGINTIYPFSNIYSPFPIYDFTPGSPNINDLQLAQNQILACAPSLSSTTQIASLCMDVPLNLPQTPTSSPDYTTYNVGKFLQLDDFIPSLFSTPFLQEKILRVFIQSYSMTDPVRNIYKIYPPSYLDSTQIQYSIFRRYYQEQQQVTNPYPNGSSKIIVQGPYNTTFPNGTTVEVVCASITIPFPFGTDTIFYHIRIEILMSVIQEFVNSQNYRSDIEIIILNKRRQFVYLTDYWKKSYTGPSQVIYDSNIQIYSGLDEPTLTDLITNKTQQATVSKLNKQGVTKDYLVEVILLADTFNANDPKSYFTTGVNDPVNDNFFIFLIYGEKSQMYQVQTTIQDQTSQIEYVTVRICIVSSLITIVLVYVATSLVTVQVQRPLNVLNIILRKLNNSTTIKQNTLLKIREQLRYQYFQSQYQVQELVKSFSDLIDKMIETSTTKNQIIPRKIEYPLNDLEINFVKTTKGNQIDFDVLKFVNLVKDKFDGQKEQTDTQLMQN
ncbi:transmembrane protein, putative (macronuclear) [Tetrahymena thermophila SB210]|uniref:Transmembrane protein, putative n=1 Tax=Tetrahymena thermophila (strain SB210) TaxID=312017 RepID=I7MIT7_TETTS|nr:transmembrane protein, putative [Tetrahymena thermophila SB210]EAS04732.2 transmembrane protein, putative [Tetrahymena thermophila SB210]|eukprot:XP_001024977.2 transmembrane protein, putative [Tetrahymena thermophila SB210]